MRKTRHVVRSCPHQACASERLIRRLAARHTPTMRALEHRRMAAAKSDRLNVRLSLLVTDEGENAKCAAPTFTRSTRG